MSSTSVHFRVRTTVQFSCGMEADGSSRSQQCYCHPCRRRIALPFRINPALISRCVSRYSFYFLACQRMRVRQFSINLQSFCFSECSQYYHPCRALPLRMRLMLELKNIVLRCALIAERRRR